MATFTGTIRSDNVQANDTVHFTPTGKAREIAVKVGQVMLMPGQTRIWGFKVTASDRPAKGRGYVLPSLVKVTRPL